MGSAFVTGVGDGSAFDTRGGDGEVVAGVGSGSGAVLGMTYETPRLDVGTHCG